MIDRSAIEKIESLAATVTQIEQADTPVIAIASNLKLESLEKFQKQRSRFKGCMTTSSLMDFADYINTGAEQLFIGAENMTAVAFFDLGNQAKPGHAEHTAILCLTKSAPYSAMLSINCNKTDQKTLSEWLEDWRDYITAIDENDGEIDTKTAINSIRKITVEAIKRGEHEHGSLAASKSSLEKIGAKGDNLPAAFIFKCKPYEDLSEREYTLRLSIHADTDNPRYILRITQLDVHKEAVAQEFKDTLKEKTLEEINAYIGNFSA